MGFLRLVGRRLLAQRLLALALVITMAFTIGVLVAGPIYASGSQEAILSGQLAQSDVALKNVRFSGYSEQGFSQNAADQSVRDAIKSLPVRGLLRQAQTYQLDFVGLRNTVQTFLGYRDRAFSHLVMKGRAPSAPNEIAVPVGTDFPLGGIGAHVQVQAGPKHSVDAVITGVFQIPTGDRTFWFGSDSIFPQSNNPTSPPTLPILTTEQGFDALTRGLDIQTGQLYAWDVYLNLTGMNVDQIRAIPAEADHAGALLARDSTLSTVSDQTGLATIVQIVDQLTGDAQVPIFLVVFQIGAVALAVLAGIASLSLSNQSFELAVLKSRGFTRGQLLLAQTAEAVLAAAIALPLGLLLGTLLARVGRAAHGPYISGSNFPVSLGFASVVTAIIGALVAAVLVVLVSIPHVSRTVVEERRETSRASRPLLVRFPVELVVLPLGLFAFWEARVRGLGSNVVTGTIDPLVLLAPTLLLFGVSFAALRLLGWGLKGLDGQIGRVKNLPAYLAGRRLGRESALSFASALLLLLAAGLLVISSSYRATILQSHDDVAHQQVGADWSAGIDTQTQSLQAMRRVPAGATAIYRGETDLVDVPTAVSATTIGVDPATYPTGGWWRGDYAAQPLTTLLSGLRTPPPGVALPGGRLTISVDATSSLAGYRLVAMALLANGQVVHAIDEPLRPGRDEYASRPLGTARLLSLVIERPQQVQAPKLVTVNIVSASDGNGAPVDLARWRSLSWLSSTSTLSSTSEGLILGIRPGSGQVIGGIVPGSPPIPALVSSDVPQAAGRSFQGQIAGTTLSFHVVGVPSGFPGTDPNQPFVVIPESALYATLERIPEPSDGMNEIWAMGTADPAAGLRRAGFPVGQMASAKAEEGILALDAQSLAVGMHYTAAAGGMALVVIGVGAGLYFGQRRRRFEFAALRALGTEPSQMVAALTFEEIVVIVFSLGAACLAAWFLLRLMMPYLGPSISNGFPRPVLVTDWTAMAVFGIGVAAAAGAGLALAARALMRASVTSVLRGEAE